MKQKTLTGESVHTDEKYKKTRRWLRCKFCDRRIFEGRNHKCEKGMRTISFEETNIRKET